MLCFFRIVFFVFNQKTEDDLRISDWSSDVCSSDRALTFGGLGPVEADIEEAVAGSAFRVVRSAVAGGRDFSLHASGALVPAAPLRQVARLGHVNVPVDEGGMLHRLVLAIGLGDVYLPGFPVALAASHLDLAPDQMVLRLGEGLELGDRFVATDPAQIGRAQ